MSAFANLSKLPELRKRLVFTAIMVAVYRLGVHIPTPGINIKAFSKLFESQEGLLNIVNLFNGGALEQFSIFALGIMPYISASIIFQLLTVSIPSLKRLQEEGEAGRQKINQWTRYGTVLLSLIQGFGISYGLYQKQAVLENLPMWRFVLTAMVTLAAGTCFIMWLGEQITERGIGNGISLLIFSGIVARIPKGFEQAWTQKEDFGSFIGFLLLLGFIFVLISAIIFFERAQRRIPIQYAKRIIGRKMYAGQSTHLPLKINMAGVIPPIFASSILLFPATIAGFSENATLKQVAALFNNNWFHDTLYVIGIIFFTYFYTAVSFDPQNVAENLQKNGGFIPGIRPGKPTVEFMDRVLTRITLGGALYLSTICVLPQILINQFNIPANLAFTFGGTSLLIVVGVAMDTVAQVESHLMARNYEGFLGAKAGRFKGRRA